MNKVALLLTLLLTVSVVHAQTHTVTNTSDSGPGSLRQTIINAGVGDTIRFSSALLTNGSDTVSLFFPISILKSVTIKGLYNATDTLYISGNDSTQLFFIDLSSTQVETIRLDSLVLINGKSSTEGGCIYVSEADSLVVTNSIIRNNRTIGGVNGGGLIAYNSTVHMDNCRIESNRIDQVHPSFGYGGGLRFVDSNVKVSNSFFVDNESRRGGGGISFINCYFEVASSRFFFNRVISSSFYGGGAMSSTYSDRNSVVFRSEFHNNTSIKGGAIVFVFDTTDIKECTFAENSCDTHGGALFVQESTFSCIGSLFLNNTSTQWGGAAYISSSNVNVETSTFAGNETHQNGGGALYISAANVDIRNSTFISNMAPTGKPTISLGISSTGGSSISSSIVLSGPNNVDFSGSSPMTSGGFNIFSTAPPFAQTSDQTNIDSTILALEPLADYGGFTNTMIPSLTSVALNAGDSTDFLDAQNGPIFGRRDVGAAERPIISSDTLLACSPVNWWGNTYSTAGTYRDTVFNANSIDSVGVLILNRQDTSVINDSGVLIALEDDSNTTYQWVDCNNGFAPVAGATDSAFMPTVNGTYAVILTNDNCSDTSACILYDEVSIEEAARSLNWITFYPNPTSGEIQYKFEGTVPASLEVLDLGGRQLFTQQLSNAHYLTLPDMPAGTYFLRWTGEDGTVQVDRVVVR